MSTRKIFRWMMFSVSALNIIAVCGCGAKYFHPTENFPSELVSVSKIPKYKRIVVCQGPAKIQLNQRLIKCFVRCFDSNNDGEMLSMHNQGIDIFEYSIPNIGCGQSEQSDTWTPIALMVDYNFDGIGDFIYVAQFGKGGDIQLYRKIRIINLHIVMDDYDPSTLNLMGLNPAVHMNY